MPRSKRKISFLTFVNRKYKKLLQKKSNMTMFYDFDDYALFLYYDLYKKDYEDYYWNLENDLREYVNLQMNIKPRTRKAE